MSEVSFEKRTEVVTTPVPGVTIACESTACEVIPQQVIPQQVIPHPQNVQVPAVQHEQSQAVSAPGGLVLGDKIPEFKDIILPRLNIVQGTGELKDSFPQGAVVFGQSLVLFAPPIINAKTGMVEKPGTAPVTITVLGFRPTRFSEKVSGGVRGMIVDTEDEVTKAGGTLNYKEWDAKKDAGMKRFEPLADALVVVERPEIVADDDTVFIYPCDGKKYALALWALKGTAYTAAAKGVFFTARAVGCLKGGYPSYSFALSTRQKSGNGNTWNIPVCLPKAKSTPSFLEFAANILNG